MISIFITFSLYYGTVGTLIWWVSFAWGGLDQYEGCSRVALIAASAYVILAWPFVLWFVATQGRGRG